MKKIFASGVALGACVFLGLTPIAAHAQAKTPAPVTLDLRDTPVRQALELLFTNAKVDYTIDNNVQGYVTLKITDQPFDNALRLLLRSANPPLTYTNEGGVYQVRPRTDPTAIAAGGGMMNPTPPTPDGRDAAAGTGAAGTTTHSKLDKITIMYSDAADIAMVFGGSVINIGSGRSNGQGGQQGGFGGGGMGGGFGGQSMGGMGGGFGGQQGGGGFGGGFGGQQGGGFGGGGQMGGFGGGGQMGGFGGGGQQGGFGGARTF